MKRIVTLTATSVLVALLAGCVHFQTKPDANALAQTLQLSVKYASREFFAKNPDWAPIICPFVRDVILPQLAKQDCAGLQLRDQALAALALLGKTYDLKGWDEALNDLIKLLDSYLKPTVKCTYEQWLYLNAFFTGIVEGCPAEG